MFPKPPPRMAPPTVADVSSTDLFQDEVPMLRPSLVKHGLVDLACPPPPRVEQVIWNLVVVGNKAMRDSGRTLRLTVSVSKGTQVSYNP